MLGARGFTLLEVLVSMAIFAVIGLGANQMLRTVIQTHDRTQEQVQSFSQLTRAFAVMERDFSQVVPRNVRDEYGEPLPAFSVATGPFPVEFTRTGWSNPLGLPRSQLQRVAYELDDEKTLNRHFWLVIDRAEDSEPVTQALLSNVLDYRVSLLTLDGDTVDSWPDFDGTEILPLAAELLVEVEGIGTIRKVFALPRTAKPLTSLQGGAVDGDEALGDEGTGDDEDSESTSQGQIRTGLPSQNQ